MCPCAVLDEEYQIGEVVVAAVSAELLLVVPHELAESGVTSLVGLLGNLHIVGSPCVDFSSRLAVALPRLLASSSRLASSSCLVFSSRPSSCRPACRRASPSSGLAFSPLVLSSRLTSPSRPTLTFSSSYLDFSSQPTFLHRLSSSQLASHFISPSRLVFSSSLSS